MVDYDGDKAYQDYLALEGQDEASRQAFLDEHTYHMQKGLEKLKSFINELSI
jgi:hypothetical protein